MAKTILATCFGFSFGSLYISNNVWKCFLRSLSGYFFSSDVSKECTDRMI